MKIGKHTLSTPIALVCNIFMVYLIYFVCRVVFVAENWSVYSETLFKNNLSDLIIGSLVFDSSGIVYTNALYIVMMLIPLHYKEGVVYQKICKGIFVFCNSVGIIANLVDCVYFQYSGRRTTVTVFREFSNEDNLVSVFGVEFINHWYIVLIGIALIFCLFRFYVKSEGDTRFKLFYYISHTIVFVGLVLLAVCGMRGGGFSEAVRPITISNANQYVNRPAEASVILNTPFSMIRTYNKKPFSTPHYFDKNELDSIYSPVSQLTENKEFKDKNVVVFIIESFGREYIGSLNENLEGGNYKGYTPFVDSIVNQSLTFDYSFCNGRKSIDGMPSILSSIPMFVEPFFLTPASLNDISGIAGELGKKGYHTAFFHGAQNGSMGFQAFARATGFQEYYGRTEYNEDSRFNGDDDYDGTWAIWDEPFFQFYCLKMSEFQQPFVTSIFTASSHHPYAVPSEYKDIYPEEGLPIHKCIRYTDNALRKFFDTAKKQPWFDNTIFVFTSDHTNQSDHPEFQTDLGIFWSPVIIYDPSKELVTPCRRHAIAQQIDIMPTVLNILGYDNSYIAFGQDLMNTPDSSTWAVNYNNGIYQFVKNDYLLQFDGNNVVGFFNIKNDWMLRDNLKGRLPEEEQLLKELKAIIQSYMERMNSDEVVVR